MAGADAQDAGAEKPVKVLAVHWCFCADGGFRRFTVCGLSVPNKRATDGRAQVTCQRFRRTF
jgi:hypothetical protein